MGLRSGSALQGNERRWVLRPREHVQWLGEHDSGVHHDGNRVCGVRHLQSLEERRCPEHLWSPAHARVCGTAGQGWMFVDGSAMLFVDLVDAFEVEEDCYTA